MQRDEDDLQKLVDTLTSSPMIMNPFSYDNQKADELVNLSTGAVDTKDISTDLLNAHATVFIGNQIKLKWWRFLNGSISQTKPKDLCRYGKSQNASVQGEGFYNISTEREFFSRVAIERRWWIWR